MTRMYAAVIVLLALCFTVGCQRKDNETEHGQKDVATWYGSYNGVIEAYDAIYVSVLNFEKYPRLESRLWCLGKAGQSLQATWSAPVGNYICQIIGARDGSIFTGDSHGTVSRVDAKTGEIIWQTSTGLSPAFWYTISKHYVYITSPYAVAALPLDSGTPVATLDVDTGRRQTTVEAFSTCLAIGENVLFLDRLNACLVAVRDTAGWPVVWEINRPEWLHAVNMVGIGDSAAITDKEQVQLINPATGKVLWSKAISSAIVAFITGQPDMVYLIEPHNDNPDQLIALNKQNGDIIWTHSAGYANGKPLQCQNTVLSRQNDVALLVGSEVGSGELEPIVVCLDKQSGKQLWQMPTDAKYEITSPVFQIAASGDSIVAATQYALFVRHADGSMQSITDPSRSE